jgi:dihydroxyacetone kinase-like protein
VRHENQTDQPFLLSLSSGEASDPGWRLVKKKARKHVDARWMRSGCHSEPIRQLPRAAHDVYTRAIGNHQGRAVSVPSPSVAPSVDAGQIRAGLARARNAVDRHAAALTRLDAVLGDGDHGDNLSTGFRAVEELLTEMAAETPPGELLRAVGYRLVATVGGASGPLLGTAFIEAGFRAGEAEVLGPALVGDMLVAAAAGLARRGRCSIGDKTILDTLGPAAAAFTETIRSGGSGRQAQAAALEAGRLGMRSTRPLVARRGLALRLGERSAGHLDPGAVSCFVLLLALAER